MNLVCQQETTNMHDGMFGFGPNWMLFVSAIVVLPFWRICTKAGYSGWLSLLILIPLANVVFVYFLGFSQWPSLRGRAFTRLRA
jgi:hypothetical protein